MTKWVLWSLSLAFAGGLAAPAGAPAAEGNQPEQVMVDSLSSTSVSVSDAEVNLDIVLLPDPVPYRPMHPDSLDENDATEFDEPAQEGASTR